MSGIYLDNNATTRVSTAVLELMRPYLSDAFGNASSVHAMGQAARHAIESAREAVASLIHAGPEGIAFTTSGTESDRLAISGLLGASPKKRRIVTTAVEHSAVLDFARRLEWAGYDVIRVGVDASGVLDMGQLADALSTETALVSVMLANNETGVISPVQDVALLARSRGIPMHVDAVQGAGRLGVDVDSLGADLVSLSAHKIHGPKGAGALWIRSGTRFVCPYSGARSARELRQGTENVAAIAGFGLAAKLAVDALGDLARVAEMRDRLESSILDADSGASIAGAREKRIANTTTICFRGLEAEAILIGLSERGVYASSGSACSSGSIEPSHVLAAMGLPSELTRGAIRFSLSRETTEEEVSGAIGHVRDVVGRLRAFSA